MGKYSVALNMPRITSTIVVTANNTTISRKRIIVSGSGITNAGGYDNLTIESCIIKYNTGKNTGTCRGIDVVNAAGVTIRDCEVINMGAPDRGPLPSTSQSCIYIETSSTVDVRRVTLRRGSSGLQLISCTDTNGEDVESHDMRGPYPRGQAMQFNSCLGTHLWTNLSDESIPGTSWNEDSFNIYNTPNVTLDGVFIPMQSDGLSGRGFVMEIEGTTNCTIRNAELLYTYNGAGGGFQVGTGNVYENIKVKYYNRYSVRAIAGSSNSGTTLPALCVTGFNPVAGVYTDVDFIFYGIPIRCPDGSAYAGGDINNWYNPTDIGGIAQGTGSVTEQDWTVSRIPVRNSFPWRSVNSKPTFDIPPRINSYWLDGRIGTTIIPGTSILGLLPGRYKHDPTSRSFQWRKNGVNISGATGIDYDVLSSDSGSVIDCVETVTNAGGSFSLTTPGIRIP